MASFYRYFVARKSQYFPPIVFTGIFSMLLFVWLWQFDADLEDEKIVVDSNIFSPCNATASNSQLTWKSPPTSGYRGRIYPDITITYDNPKTYKGPVIKGWEPTKDRNSTIYVRPTENTILLDPLTCSEEIRQQIDMVILQHSAPKNFNIRMANRYTWMKYGKQMPEVRIFFVIGVPTVSPEDLDHVDVKVQQQLKEEFLKFGDILQVDSYESYSNNTLKALHSLKYLLGVDWKRMSHAGKPPRFVMRTDDDVYINLPLVQKAILKNKQWFDLDGKSHWPPMLGDMLDQSPVVKILPENMNDKYAPKAWYECPTYFHNGEGVYPSYMQGAGYFLPWWAIACIYQQSFQVPYFFIEDVFVGGWMADRCALPKHHLEGFTMFRPNKPIRKVEANLDFLIHYVDKNYKIKLHRYLNRVYDVKKGT